MAKATASLVPECFACRNLVGVNPEGGWQCAAFDRIPTEILASRRDHRSAYPGDSGVRFAPGEPAAVSRQDAATDKQPVHAAGVMLVTDSGHVLLLKRADTDEWAFPGGHVEDGESEEEAARRECEEETGFKPDELRPWTHRVDDPSDFTTFLSRIPERFTPVLNDEHTDYRWELLGDVEGDALDHVLGRADATRLDHAEKQEMASEAVLSTTARGDARSSKLDAAVALMDHLTKPRDRAA